MSEEQEALRHQHIDNELRVLRIIGGAMFMGIVLITGVFAFLLSQGERAPSGQMEILGLLAPLVATGAFFIGFVVGPIASRAPEGASVDEKSARLRSGALLRISLNEGAALFAAMAVFITRSWTPAGLGIAIGALGLILAIPGRAAVESALDEDQR